MPRTIVCEDDPQNPGSLLFQELSTIAMEGDAEFGPTCELKTCEEFEAWYLENYPGDAELLPELMARAVEEGSSNPHFDFGEPGLAF